MKFSVVIPMYNTAPYVEATVRSVLAQEYADFEVIVVNDGSTDGCGKIIAAMDDPRIVLINKPNTGVSDTRNVGCRAAKGEYIAFLDSDDYWYPNHLGEAAAFFDEHPEILWYGARQFSLPIGTDPSEHQQGSRQFVIRNIFVDGKRYIDSTSLIAKRELIEQSGGYPVGMAHFEDWLFQTRLGTLAPLLGTNECVTSIYHVNRKDSARNNLPKDAVESLATVLRAMVTAVEKNGVTTPGWPREVVLLTLRFALFDRPKETLLALIDEFASLQGPARTRRWRLFARCAYRFDSPSLHGWLCRMTQMSARERFASVGMIRRELGIGAATSWICVLLMYTARGLADQWGRG